MRSGWLNIELRSELTTATGDTLEGLVNVEIAHIYGLPVVPAKRLKGSLLEVGKELVDWGILKTRDLYALFGETGLDASSPLQLYDAQLYQIPDGSAMQTVEDAVELLRQLREQGWQEQDVLESFTDLYTRTAIDERDGAVKEGHLRTVRAVHKGIVLRSRVELHEDMNAEALEHTLRMCVKGLRHLGLASTRGSGEIRCGLTELADVDEPVHQAVTDEKELGDGRVELPFHLELEQPVVIAGRKGLETSSEEWIPGSALLGAFAGLYIREYACGQQAHEDERFSRIFLRDGVSFGYALPLVEGRVFAPSTAMWQQEKNKPRGFDLLRGSKPSDTELRDMKGMVHAVRPSPDAKQAEPIIRRYEVRKQVRMHHSRANNRAIGHALGAERTAEGTGRDQSLEYGAANGGQLYQYEAIEAGQRFYGVLQGRQEDVRLLLELAEKQHQRLRLGRSRTAEYGNVRFVPRSDSCPVLLSGEPDTERSAFVGLLLVTPMLLLDDSGRPDPVPKWLTQQIASKLGCDVEVQSVRLRYTTLSGYNAKWRLPKPQRTALDAGSVIALKLSKPIAVKELESIFWGWDTGEGNGQVRVMPLHEDEPQPGPPQSFHLAVAEPDGVQFAGSAAPHPLLSWLSERQRRKQWLLEQQAAGAQCAEPISVKQVNSTKIQQMKLWAEAAARADGGNEGGYVVLYAQVKQIKQDKLRQHCLELIEPCKDQSNVFIRSYLRALELKARAEYEQSDS